MQIIIIIVAAIILLALGALIWWYYPIVRNPWKPQNRVQEHLQKICRTAGTEFPPGQPAETMTGPEKHPSRGNRHAPGGVGVEARGHERVPARR